MSDTKILQTLLDNQVSMQEGIGMIENKVSSIENEIGRLANDIKRLEDKVDKVDSRIDKIGQQLAYLDDDAPTGEDFNKLEKRVTKLEHLVKEY